MGVCGYTYDQVSAMPIDALARAISARNKFTNTILRAFLGGSEAEAPKAVERPATLATFDELFGGTA